MAADGVQNDKTHDMRAKLAFFAEVETLKLFERDMLVAIDGASQVSGEKRILLETEV